jgi:hypothetical protein
VTTFANVLVAESRGDHALARTIAQVARSQFRPPLQAWVTSREAGDPHPPRPFDDPAYRDSLLRPAGDLQSQANAASRRAGVAKGNADQFVMRTVMLALALFFLGISGQLKSRMPRRLALTIGTVVVVLTLFSLARLERAPRPHLARADCPSCASWPVGPAPVAQRGRSPASEGAVFGVARRLQRRTAS